LAVSSGKKVKWLLSWKSSTTLGILPQISQGEFRCMHSCITNQCCVKNLSITFQRIVVVGLKFCHKLPHQRHTRKSRVVTILRRFVVAALIKVYTLYWR
jgi:hypothetical protein